MKRRKKHVASSADCSAPHDRAMRWCGWAAWRALLASSALTAAAMPSAVRAASADDPRRPEVFAPRFIEAVTSKDPGQRKAIIHSLSRACMNSQTQPYFDWIISKQASLVRAGDHKATATPIEGVRTVLPTDGQSDYPTRPTHQLQIDFVTGPYSSSGVIVFVAIEGNQWREVLPCPRGDVLSRARTRQAEQRMEEQKLKILLKDMPGRLRAELLALLQAGRKIDAISRYRAATGEDLTVAVSVINSLAENKSAQ